MSLLVDCQVIPQLLVALTSFNPLTVDLIEELDEVRATGTESGEIVCLSNEEKLCQVPVLLAVELEHILDDVRDFVLILIADLVVHLRVDMRFKLLHNSLQV